MTNYEEAELQLLARLHYALAILTAICSLIGVPFIWTGAAVMQQSAGVSDEAYLAAVLSFSAGVLWASLCVVHAGVVAYIGRLIRACRRRWLVVVFSVLHLINIPLGTALSIYVFIVLKQDGVKARFGKPRAEGSDEG